MVWPSYCYLAVHYSYQDATCKQGPSLYSKSKEPNDTRHDHANRNFSKYNLLVRTITYYWHGIPLLLWINDDNRWLVNPFLQNDNDS